MKDEFSITGDEYHKTLFGDDWTDVFDVIKKYPLIFRGVDEELRKYLSYMFIREIKSVDLFTSEIKSVGSIAKKRKLNKEEKIKFGFGLIERMIKRGGLDDQEDLKSKERKIIYKIQKTSVIKVKGLQSGVRKPFWYVDTDHIEDYVRKERKMIFERIKSQIDEYSSKHYYKCGSCGEVYDSEGFFRIRYKCEKCGAERIKYLNKHPDTQWLRDVLKRMNVEIPA